MHPSSHALEILKKTPESHSTGNGAWVMYLKIDELYEKAEEWHPPWLSPTLVVQSCF